MIIPKNEAFVFLMEYNFNYITLYKLYNQKQSLSRKFLVRFEIVIINLLFISFLLYIIITMGTAFTGSL